MNESNSETEQPASPGASMKEALLWAGGLVVVVGAWWFLTGSAPPRATNSAILANANDYVGDRACASCHAGEAAAHGRSGHSRTLRPALESPVARKVVALSADDPEVPGARWGFSNRGNQLAAERSFEGSQESLPVEYALGSGHHATTFVTLSDHTPEHPVAFEHRMTYFAHTGKLDVTPGQSLKGKATGNSPRGRTHSVDDTLRCFDCHATRTSNRGSSVLDEATMIPNVSCERCHGPGKQHIKAAESGQQGKALAMPQGPGSWTAVEQMEQCGSCHRTPSMVQAESIRVDNPNLVRHQPVGLMQSACFKKSEGQLSCVTCHDPHARSSRDRPRYEATCLSCHNAPPDCKPCTTGASSGCLDCHMPQREIARGMTLTDHWIRRRP